MAKKNLANFGSGNDLLPDSIKQLPEPVLTKHQKGFVAFTSDQFQWNNARYDMILKITNLILQPHLPGANSL